MCEITPVIQNMVTSYSVFEIAYVSSTADPYYPPIQGGAGGMGWAAVFGLAKAIELGQGPFRNAVGNSIVSIFRDKRIQTISYPELWVSFPFYRYSMLLTFVLQEQYIQGVIEFVGTVSQRTHFLITRLTLQSTGTEMGTHIPDRSFRW